LFVECEDDGDDGDDARMNLVDDDGCERGYWNIMNNKAIKYEVKN
jgi:hypothetical protein